MHDTQYAAYEVENSEPGQPERLFGICQAVGDHLEKTAAGMEILGVLLEVLCKVLDLA